MINRVILSLPHPLAFTYMHHSLRRAGLVLNLVPASIRSPARHSFCFLGSACVPSISRVNWSGGHLSRRSLSSKSDSLDVLFNYTSGHWLVNENLRFSERKREFDVEELCRLAAQSVSRSPQDVDKIVKLGEGGSNRSFLITMHDGFQMVARIPYPRAFVVPKFYSIASEVATMRFLRSSGLPVPEVYDYSPSPDNAAKVEYIFMEYFRGKNLGDLWFDLEDSQIISVLRQLVQLESRMMAFTFPAGGSLFYAEDLEKFGGKGIPLEDDYFCVGPDVRMFMWYGRRSQLDVDRGPYRSVEATLVTPAQKERAYLERFGKPLQPFHRERRMYYGFMEQSPSDHLKNLERYLLVAPSLIPEDPAFHQFHIRHPDLRPDNVIVTTSPDSKQLEVVGLIDWQHTSILPQFLLAEVPSSLQNYNDPFSYRSIPPSLPPTMDELDPQKQLEERVLYHRRFVHFHYVQLTKMYNRPHSDALGDPVCNLLRRLFLYAGAPWRGETHELKKSLIVATESWEELAKKGVPCPIVFEPEEIRDTEELAKALKMAEQNLKTCQKIAGFDSTMWVPNEHYEICKEQAAMLTRRFFEMLTAQHPDLRDVIQEYFGAHWLLNDMDETDYM